ncbi:MAG TPA: hypothetical protein VFU36_18035 [Jatrophihabitans sp.]|nr:hypothetical protein [Jatrophihabitans sp.]
MKHTRTAVAGATAVLAASMIGAISAAPADAQTRITSDQQLRTSIQHAVAQVQAGSMTLSTGPAGTPV